MTFDPFADFENDRNPLVIEARKMRQSAQRLYDMVRQPLAANQEPSPTGQRFRIYSDVKLTSSGNTVTCSPCESSQVSLLTPLGWITKDFVDTITHDATGAVSGTKYDFFLYFDDVSNTWVLDKIAWASEDTRATALDTVEGVSLSSADNTWRYIGMGRYNGSTMLISSIDPNGELFFGTGDPHNNVADPFTGAGMSGAGVTFGSTVFQFFAALAGVVGVGFNNLGQLIAGAGAVILDALGLTIQADGVIFKFFQNYGASAILCGFLELIPDVGFLLLGANINGPWSITNGDFESGNLTGWDTVSGSPSVTNALSHGGSYSLRIDGASVRTSSFYNVGGTGSYLSFWAYSATSSLLNFYIDCYNSGSSLIGQSNTTVNNIYIDDARWKRYVVWGDYPAGTTKIKLRFDAPGTPPAMYIDDVTAAYGNGFQLSSFTNSAGAFFSGKLTTGGRVSALNFNGVAVTPPANGATLTIADGKTLTVSNDATVSGANTGDQTLAGLGGVPTTRTLTGTAPIAVDGDNTAHDLSANRTISIAAATTSVPGSMSAADKTKLDAIINNTYTPTLTNTTNIAASTARVTGYFRVGSCVHVFGSVNVDPTAAGACVLGMSLPIASNFANTWECSGNGIFGIANYTPVRMIADAANDRVQFDFTAADGTARELTFEFSYSII